MTTARSAVLVNLDDTIRVRVTEIGKELYKKYHQDMIDTLAKAGANREELERSFLPAEIETDAEGWSEWTLWQLGYYFGAGMCNGCPPPVEMEIQLLRNR